MNIYLIGYRCTGKTSVGRSLAAGLKWGFIDADLTLVDRYGVTITAMVDTEGWDVFRRREKEVLQEICAVPGHVVATGGGAILDKENVECMKDSGVLVWLKARSETIKGRIIADQNTEDQRPSLTGQDLMEEIDDVLAERHPLYENTMNFSIDTDNLSIEDISGRILNRLINLEILGA